MSMTTAERIQRAGEEAAHGDYQAAQTLALIAIAELLQVNLAETYNAGVLAGAQAGATATVDAMSTIMGIVRP